MLISYRDSAANKCLSRSRIVVFRPVALHILGRAASIIRANFTKVSISKACCNILQVAFRWTVFHLSRFVSSGGWTGLSSFFGYSITIFRSIIFALLPSSIYVTTIIYFAVSKGFRSSSKVVASMVARPGRSSLPTPILSLPLLAIWGLSYEGQTNFVAPMLGTGQA